MRTRAVLAVLALAIGGLAACGGDDDDDAAAGGQSKKAFCAVNAKVTAAFDDAFEGLDENSSPEDISNAVVEATSNMVDDGLMDEARKTAPDEIADDVEELAKAVEAAADGKPETIVNGETDDAGKRVDEYCGVKDDDG